MLAIRVAAAPSSRTIHETPFPCDEKVLLGGRSSWTMSYYPSLTPKPWFQVSISWLFLMKEPLVLPGLQCGTVVVVRGYASVPLSRAYVGFLAPVSLDSCDLLSFGQDSWHSVNIRLHLFA